MIKLQSLIRILLAALICHSTSVSAQKMLDPIVNPKRYQTEFITPDRGLSAPLMQDICLDRYGFLWIGTQYGLDRYDGYTITRMSDVEYKGQMISMEWIWSISEDQKGTLWVCSSRGLFRYDRASNSFDMILPNPEDPFSEDNQVFSVKQDSRGIQWVFTRGGLFTYNESKESFNDYKKDSIMGREVNFGWTTLMAYNKHRFVEDISGRVWICSTNGLKRYDPEEDKFVTFRHDPGDTLSISGDFVYSALEEKLGNLWFVAQSTLTDKIELNILIDADKVIFKKYDHDPADSKSLVSDWVFPLYSSKDSNLWIGGLNGFSKFNYETDDFDNYMLPGGRNMLGAVFDIKEDPKGNLWMIRNSLGLTSFNPANEITYHYWCDYANPDNLLPDDHIYEILIDQNGTIWLTGQNGVTRSDPYYKQFHTMMSDTLKLKPYQDEMISSIYYDPEGSLWFGGQFGLYNSPDYKPGGQNEFIRVTERYTYSLFRDSDGQFWIGSYGGGLGKLNEKNNHIKWFRWHENHPDSISSNFITMMFEDSRELFWVIPYGNGLNIYDSRHERFISINFDPEDPEGLISNSYWVVNEDQDGNMWFASLNEGLDMLEMSKGLADSIGMVFEGKLHRDSLYFRFRHVKSNHLDPNSLNSNQIMDMYTDRSGRLWIATTNGLSLYNKENDNFYAYSTSHGLPDNVIMGIEEDNDGDLWLSTRKGICEVVLEDGIGPDLINSVNSYREDDGLQGDVFWENSCHTSSDGWMCFGGTNGFTVFHPDSIKDNYTVPPVFITDILINDQSIYSQEKAILETGLFETEEIELPFKQNSLAFEYIALNYSNAEQNRYRYRMEGLDEDWVEAGTRRYAEYRDLKAGEYTFRVIGSNDDGLWNEEGASIGIIIHPPWYRTILAYFIYVVLLTGLAYGYMLWRTRRIRQERDQLELQVKERTAVIESQNRDMLEVNTQLEEQKEELEQQTEELMQQKEELQITLDRLKETQDQLIQSEKLAALGGLVAGVAHEINTPVGISVTAASNLVEETKLMAEKYKANKISKADFKEYLSTANQSAKLILANMERTAEMVQSFKQISADQSTGEKRRVVLRTYVEDIIRSLYPKLKGRKMAIVLEIDPNLELDSYPGAISQIFTNLIINSLVHGYDEKDKGEISIQSEILNGKLVINYSDSGKGIDGENIKRIFEPFFTTNKKAGTGLGLHIVYNLVTQKLNGEIECKSELKRGTTFQISFPV